MHIGEVIHKRTPSDNLISDKTKSFNNQISDNQISYKESMEIINGLPFQIDHQYHKLVAWQLRRVGMRRFTECAEAAIKARSPERYLMVCLKKEGTCTYVPIREK